MNERITQLTKLTLEGKMFVEPVKTEFDREDLFLPRMEKESKRLCEYILNQEPKLTEYSTMTGYFRFDGSVVGDAFQRSGHIATRAVMNAFYLKPIDNLSTMEWQHATADYKKILNKGISGIIQEIDDSLAVHSAPEEVDFLHALKKVANALVAYAHKCSDRALEFSKTVENPEYKANLEKLAKALHHVPEYKPDNFYEAVLSVYFCFSADPDSLGTLDRYLYPFYEQDKKAGTLTDEEAKEALQELFLMVQAVTPVTSDRFTRGGESHFCIGGYLPNGEDGFNAVSRLILESMLDLPTYIPQVTLRWTKKLPKEIFRYVMDCERKDPHKRIAFQNDEKRIKCYTEVCGIPYENAVSYTTVGCNEPAFVGAITGSNSKVNFLRSIDTLFHKKSDWICSAQTFEEFYAMFEAEMTSDLTIAYAYDDKYNAERAKDINYISSLFFNGCIENAKSLTQGGGTVAIAAPMLIGIPNVIDSLIVVKQFVFDEQLISMQELCNAVQANWNGYEKLRTIILKKGDFFGNDTERSNAVAQAVYNSLYEYLKDKTNLFGYHWLVGDLLGYNIHHQWFGEKTLATPDGRFAGALMKFGIGQSEGRDRNGLAALMNSIAHLDPHAIACGSTVTNFTVDEQMIRNDESFEKTVEMLETYFLNGGVHFQLTYVSQEDLKNAKITPEDYQNVRVRVTGFSDYFVRLKDSIQDDIIARTTHNN